MTQYQKSLFFAILEKIFMHVQWKYNWKNLQLNNSTTKHMSTKIFKEAERKVSWIPWLHMYVNC